MTCEVTNIGLGSQLTALASTWIEMVTGDPAGAKPIEGGESEMVAFEIIPLDRSD